MIDIKIDQFQGPLSLLLRIIEKEELDITSVSLAKIADEYLEYIQNSQEILPERMADFLLMASKLIYLKSKALIVWDISAAFNAISIKSFTVSFLRIDYLTEMSNPDLSWLHLEFPFFRT